MATEKKNTNTESPIDTLKKKTSSIMLTNNLLSQGQDVRYYDRLARFGVLDPYNKLTFGKEYLFFTKPDLHIYTPNTSTLQPVFANDPFFVDLDKRLPEVILQLQRSAGAGRGSAETRKSPFMNLLCNSVTNNLELSGLTAGTMDGPANMWGGTNSYRKDAWMGDEQIEFTLEFEDTKTLDIYYLLKAYENYHRYMMMGYIFPPNIGSAPADDNGQYFDAYTANKELHTTFGIYKFIVDDDYTTILYWAYVCGSYFMNVPRDAFNSIDGVVSDGLKYSVDFKAFCADDMNPVILSNFNKYVLDAYGDKSSYTEVGLNKHVTTDGTEFIDFPSDDSLDYYTTFNGEWGKFPLIKQVDRTNTNGLPSTMDYKYELHWYK